MRYATIVADPPWHYDGFVSMKGRPGSRERREGADRSKGQRVDKTLPYASMSVDQISELPVRSLALDDANLFLWTTNRYLPDAFGVCEKWGFAYRQTIVWSKPAGSRPPFVASIAPNGAEYLLVCRIGRGAPFTGSLESSVVEAKRQGFAQRTPLAHSEKPELFLDLIESVSPGPYLELFARRQRLNWDTWGDEALEHVSIPASSPDGSR